MEFKDPPTGWKLDRLYNLALLRTSNVDKNSEEGERPVLLCNYTDVYNNERIDGALRFMEATANEGEIEKFSLEPGDVVITKDSESPDDIGVPALVAEKVDDLLCGYHLAILRPFKSVIAGRYLFYALASRLSAYQFYLAANGVTRFGLTYQGTKNIRIRFPPVRQQLRIADFLDHKTTEIDALIAKKQELIAKLKEQRIAIITQSVTKGIDSKVPMRDSGFDWLGQIPTHWEVKRLKWAVMLQRGHDLPTEERIDGSVPIVTSSGISGSHNFAIAKAPGIVTGRYGTVGTFYLIEEDYWPLNTTLYSTDLHGNCPRFLLRLLENIAPLFLLNSVKSAVPGVDRNDVLSIPVALPDREEQIRIADHIDKRSREIDELTGKIKAAITRLTEYRTALITAATTGEIDVRI